MGTWLCCQVAVVGVVTVHVVSVVRQRLTLPQIMRCLMGPAYTSDNGWRQDTQYATSTGRGVAHSPYLSLWVCDRVALDDMTAEGGCLAVLPGGRGEGGGVGGECSAPVLTMLDGIYCY
jgi:ectoine hydroxylase-related dioxygenase (phytanoyl-CoA dioxygenase family)